MRTKAPGRILHVGSNQKETKLKSEQLTAELKLKLNLQLYLQICFVKTFQPKPSEKRQREQRVYIYLPKRLKAEVRESCKVSVHLNDFIIQKNSTEI